MEIEEEKTNEGGVVREYDRLTWAQCKPVPLVATSLLGEAEKTTRESIDEPQIVGFTDVEADAKRKPWSMDDEKLLVASWIAISTRNVAGNSQTQSSFWCRITSYFNQRRQSGAERKRESVKSHWHRLRRHASDFNRHYKNMSKQHQNELSDDELIRAAKEAYYKTNNKQFAFEHVWIMLKDDPILTTSSQVQYSSKKSRVNESAADTSSFGEDTSLNADDNEVDVCSNGQKEAKRTKRTGKSSVPTSPNADEKMDEIKGFIGQKNDETISLLRHLCAVLECQNFHRDYEVMLKDTTSMSEEQLKIHMHMRSILKAKYSIP